jgi:beta-glucanase (GH16 family)
VDSSHTPLAHFTASDAAWTSKFHIWRMDWDAKTIALYLDGELLNIIDLSKTADRGAVGIYDSPFSNDVDGFGDYILLNLAIGANGGTPDDSQFPLRYYVDYVRVYQKE